MNDLDLRALSVPCPLCHSRRQAPCRDQQLREKSSVHVARLDAYERTQSEGSVSFYPTNVQGGSKASPDYIVTFDGSLWLVDPQNAGAREHLEENVSEESQWFGHALVVEHRYIGDLCVNLGQAGYFVRVD